MLQRKIGKEAEYIQQNMTDEVIDNAFHNLPKEVQDGTIEHIKQNLKIRRSKMVHYATEYYKTLQNDNDYWYQQS